MAKITLKQDGNIARGIGLMLLSALMFALAGVAVKFAVAELSVFALVFWRNLLSFFLFILWMYFTGFTDIKTTRFDLHLLRSVFTYAALAAYFYALSRIEFASAVLLQSTGPIFVPLLALIFFRRLSDRYVWIGVVVAFIGVAVLTGVDRFSFPFGELGGEFSGQFSGVLAGLFGGCAALSIWAMSGGEPPLRQMFYFSLLTLIIAIILLPWTWQLPSPVTFIALGALAICTTLAQYFFSASLAVSPADKVNTWSYASVVIAAIIGYVIWDEHLGIAAIVGILLVIGGAHITAKKPASARARD